VFGSAVGRAWTSYAWGGVVVLALALVVAAGVLSLVLRHTPALDPRLR
jgi:hypothetical protein